MVSVATTPLLETKLDNEISEEPSLPNAKIALSTPYPVAETCHLSVPTPVTSLPTTSQLVTIFVIESRIPPPFALA